MKFSIGLILLFIVIQIGSAQQLSKFNYFIGYGFYEGINLGAAYHIRPDIHLLSLSVGYARAIDKKQEVFSISLGYELAVLRNRTNFQNKYKWYSSNRAVLWQLEDNYYQFRLVSLIPSIERRFLFFKNTTISLDIGSSFNIVLYNKRKTFEEVGWPYHVMPNFRILYIFGR